MGSSAPECAGFIVSADTMVDGSYTFNADGTGSSIRQQMIDVHAIWTPACLLAINGGQAVDVAGTCGNISSTYRSQPEYAGSACVFDGTNCDCTIMADIERTGTATYQLSGNRILTADDEPADYCVSGDTLTIVEHSENADALLVLTRTM
jgi:hypothetical protein